MKPTLDPPPDCYGWLPVEYLPLARRTATGYEPMMIEGITTRGDVVIAVYQADGDYIDRWMNRSGSVTYRLTHGRPVTP